MARAPVVAGLLVFALGCAEEPRGWTRVERRVDYYPEDVENHVYNFVHADREANACVFFSLRTRAEFHEPDPRDVVKIRGSNLVFDAASGGDYRPDCTTDFVQNGPNAVTGEIEFEFYNAAGLPCRVSYDLRVEERFMLEEPSDYVNRTYEIVAEDVPIVAADCPRAAAYSGEYTDLQAAYGQYYGAGNLVISAWDEAREACVWARFIDGGDVAQSEVEAPGAWAYGGLRFGLIERDACVADDFLIPPSSAAYQTDSAPPLGSSGDLRFVAEVDGVPCSVDVELALWSLGRFEWTPDDVFMRATNVAVAGACE